MEMFKAMAETEEKKSTISEITVDGYTFKADTDLMDDVEAFEYIDRIENKGQVAAIVPLLTFMIGAQEYAKMKAYFTEKDATDHAAELEEAGKPADKEYKGRMRMKKLQEVYLAIIEKFNPKD
jgi:hypothetical protein